MGACSSKDVQPSKSNHIPEFFYLNREKSQIFSISNNKSEKSPTNLNIKLALDSAIGSLSDTKLIIAGGTINNEPICSVYMIDMQTSSINSLPSLPFACKNGYIYAIDNFFYLVGAALEINKVYNPSPILRIHKSFVNWEEFKNFQESPNSKPLILKFFALSNYGSFVIGKKIIIVGGEYLGKHGQMKLSKSLFSISVENRSIKKESKLPIRIVKPIIAAGEKHGIILGKKFQSQSKIPKSICYYFTLTSHFKFKLIDSINFESTENYPPVYTKQYAMFISFPNFVIRFKDNLKWSAYEIKNKKDQRLVKAPELVLKEQESIHQSVKIEEANNDTFETLKPVKEENQKDQEIFEDLLSPYEELQKIIRKSLQNDQSSKPEEKSLRDTQEFDINIDTGSIIQISNDLGDSTTPLKKKSSHSVVDSCLAPSSPPKLRPSLSENKKYFSFSESSFTPTNRLGTNPASPKFSVKKERPSLRTFSHQTSNPEFSVNKIRNSSINPLDLDMISEIPQCLHLTEPVRPNLQSLPYTKNSPRNNPKIQIPQKLSVQECIQSANIVHRYLSPTDINQNSKNSSSSGTPTSILSKKNYHERFQSMHLKSSSSCEFFSIFENSERYVPKVIISSLETNNKEKPKTQFEIQRPGLNKSSSSDSDSNEIEKVKSQDKSQEHHEENVCDSSKEKCDLNRDSGIAAYLRLSGRGSKSSNSSNKSSCEESFEGRKEKRTYTQFMDYNRGKIKKVEPRKSIGDVRKFHEKNLKNNQLEEKKDFESIRNYEIETSINKKMKGHGYHRIYKKPNKTNKHQIKPLNLNTLHRKSFNQKENSSNSSASPKEDNKKAPLTQMKKANFTFNSDSDSEKSSKMSRQSLKSQEFQQTISSFLSNNSRIDRLKSVSSISSAEISDLETDKNMCYTNHQAEIFFKLVCSKLNLNFPSVSHNSLDIEVMYKSLQTLIPKNTYTIDYDLFNILREIHIGTGLLKLKEKEISKIIAISGLSSEKNHISEEELSYALSRGLKFLILKSR